MIVVEFGGTVYEGRLINIRAASEQFCTPDGVFTYRNYSYEICMMDAFGAEITLHVPDLFCIHFA